ncbi:hypothetical protein BV25DRAFT_240781 [Artomyces pyxidatus]|uniref:Uncharacterized protein n=1 Tax=Artomyces pyxidatus TaxID=48021 RepID=A0ACB8T8X3_9AGAM|nr:hypothetical protein BV25DRAFT_240781 [Artomyces pyxidatus]
MQRNTSSNLELLSESAIPPQHVVAPSCIMHQVFLWVSFSRHIIFSAASNASPFMPVEIGENGGPRLSQPSASYALPSDLIIVFATRGDSPLQSIESCSSACLNLRRPSTTSPATQPLGLSVYDPYLNRAALSGWHDISDMRTPVYTRFSRPRVGDISISSLFPSFAVGQAVVLLLLACRKRSPRRAPRVREPRVSSEPPQESRSSPGDWLETTFYFVTAMRSCMIV